MKQLRNNGRHAPKVSRPDGPLENGRNPIGLHTGKKSFGVHLAVVRHEQNGSSGLRGQLRIPFRVPGILLKVFFRPELGGIHKDGCHNDVRMFTCGPDQAQVAFVQRPHGGNNTDPFSGAPQVLGSRLHRPSVVQDFRTHRIFFPNPDWMSSTANSAD